MLGKIGREYQDEKREVDRGPEALISSEITKKSQGF